MEEKRAVVERTHRAEADLYEIAAAIGCENPSAAERFLDAVERTLHRLANMPELGVTREYHRRRLSGLRMWPVPGFRKYLIFYRPYRYGIQLVRVLHGARNVKRLFED